MKTISIVGKVDSRVIVYPLARALSLDGPTQIITDDGAYRRLYAGLESTGTINGVDISIGSLCDESLADSLNETGIPYKYRIIVSSSYVDKDSSIIIKCKGTDKSILAELKESDEKYTHNVDMVNTPKNIVTKECIISFDPPIQDGVISFSIKDTAIRYAYKCEESKQLSVMPDKSWNKNISKLVANELGLSEEDIFKYLLREEYIVDKKKIK